MKTFDKAYPTYKSSGIEWIGDIPEKWEIKKLKLLGEAITGLTYSPNDVVDENEGKLVLRASNIKNGSIVYGDNVYVDMKIPNKLITRNGDILICSRNGSRRLIGKCARIDDESQGLTFGAFTTVFRSSYANFLFYVFQSPLFTFQIGSFLTSTINQLTIGNLNSLQIPLPSINEQEKITSFLDKQTKEIDDLINYKEKMVSLLEEKRQLIITEAVTKGLNPNVKMKHSGVEWIGEIPEHWTIKKIKHISTFVGSGKTPKGGSEIYPESGVLFLRSMNVHYDGIRLKNIVHITPEIDEDMRSTRVKSKDVLLNITGASIGRSCIVPESLGKANVNQHVCIIRGNTRVVVPELLSKIMSSNFIMQQILMSQNGSSREGLNFTQVKNLECPLTRDLHEQIEIANHISVETDKVNSLISMIKQQIQKLKDYRQSLIYEAVTGKIDVRDFEIESE
ncbi:restriction endonuclease subunit S [Bacillus anthracis]|uniref:restriction endonuclease subunit S n=1 Tax=Bacillus TaxID=1386 RepID=UPI0010A5E4AF|nr:MULTISPECIES: restriction endonuclease subunit S [Bacillus]QBJ66779.1 restriction endonuclease subunit S [Bacillus anthracis]THG62943.1 restriction endonuclease subunit S [Bacillus sp. HUB-I-004]